jgi:hypothetical protein
MILSSSVELIKRCLSKYSSLALRIIKLAKRYLKLAALAKCLLIFKAELNSTFPLLMLSAIKFLTEAIPFFLNSLLRLTH